MRNNQIRLKKSRISWWIAWIFGVGAQIIYNSFSLNYYHFYIYFYAVGFIVLVDALIGWGIVSREGIFIRFGIRNTNSLFFNWNDLFAIELVYLKKRSTITSSGRDKVPFANDVFVRALVLKFKNKFESDIKNRIKGIRKLSWFKEKIELDEINNKLFVFQAPQGDFEEIVDAIVEFKDVNLKIAIEDHPKDSVILQVNLKSLFLVDFAVVFLTIGTISYYLY